MGIVLAHRRVRRRIAVLLVLATGLAMAATVDTADATGVVHESVVKRVPRTNTPEFLDDEVRAHVQIGNRIIVGGGYGDIRDDTFGVVSQPYLASYDLATGRLDMAFRPELNGPVYSLADGGDGTVIAVGAFGEVNGLNRKRVVKLKVADGSVVTAFKANASAVVNDVAVAGSRVYLGGGFFKVNNVERSLLAAVDLQTGDVASDFDFPVTEPTGYWLDEGAGIRAGAVRALDVTPDGSTLLVVHNSAKVGGQARQSIALIDIDGAPGLLPWKTNHFDYDCQPWFDLFERPLMRDGQFSPDGTYFVVGSSIGNFAPGCDVAVRFPTAGGNGVTATWVSRLFDSPEAIAITDKAIYIGGHMRWLMQPGTVWTDWANGNTDTQPANTYVRQQIGALNPPTGTALGWDPGATGFRGVLALEVTAAGLLVGSDGEVMGGEQTYRHGLFELPAAPPPTDNAKPGSVTSSPEPKQVINGPVTVTGTATDDVGVAEVFVVIQDTATNLFLQPDLTWGAAWAKQSSFVHDYQATTTQFTWAGDLPDGKYKLTVRARDVVGKVDPTTPQQVFTVMTVPDTQDPEGTLVSPTAGETLTSIPVTIAGNATDDIGVAEVSVIIKDRTTGDHLQDDNTWAPAWNAIPTTLTNPNGATTDWSWTDTPESINDGNYQVWVQVKDLVGNADPTKATAQFSVDTGMLDSEPPNGSLLTPEPGDTITAAAVSFDGTASDNVGVAEVNIIIQDVATSEFLQGDGTWGAWVALPATMGNPGGTPTAWTWEGTIDRDAQFQVWVQVKDAAGNKDPEKATARFWIETN